MTAKKLGRPKETPDYVFRKKLIYLKGNDFYCSYGIDIDYNRSYNCIRESCDSICRCSTIEDARIEPGTFDVSSLISDLSEKQEPVMSYCIERLVRLAGFNEDAFEVNVSRGYYGEEIDSVSLPEMELTALIQRLSSLLELNDEQKIKFVLQAEYGHLLEKLNIPFDVQVITVETEKVRLPNQDYYRKVDNEQLNLYDKEYPGARGVCLLKDGEYHLIDGYHRMVAAKKCGLDEVKIVALLN